MLKKCKKMLLPVLTGGVLLSASMGANAAIIDQGIHTLDTDTNLLWLDMSETYGISFADVASALVPGEAFDAYRLATNAEVTTLIGNFGLPNATAAAVGLLDGSNEAAWLNMRTLMGSAMLGPAEVIYGYTDDDYLQGRYLLDDPIDPDIINLSFLYMGSPDQGAPYIGTFLVMDAPIQSDEPSIALTMSTILMMLAYLSYRRKVA